MWRFDGRTILVTGASGGIGGATVRQLVAAGADVIASGRAKATLDALAAEVGCRALAFDLASEESVRDALEGLDLWGVVNCGGFGGEIATPMDTDIAIFDKVISVNARGALLVTKYASRSMIRRPAWRLHRQRLEPSRTGGAARTYLVRVLQGGARQHHACLGAGARALRHPGQQREPDRRHDGDVRLGTGDGPRSRSRS